MLMSRKAAYTLASIFLLLFCAIIGVILWKEITHPETIAPLRNIIMGGISLAFTSLAVSGSLFLVARRSSQLE